MSIPSRYPGLPTCSTYPPLSVPIYWYPLQFPALFQCTFWNSWLISSKILNLLTQCLLWHLLAPTKIHWFICTLTSTLWGLRWHRCTSCSSLWFSDLSPSFFPQHLKVFQSFFFLTQIKTPYSTFQSFKEPLTTTSDSLKCLNSGLLPLSIFPPNIIFSNPNTQLDYISRNFTFQLPWSVPSLTLHSLAMHSYIHTTDVPQSHPYCNLNFKSLNFCPQFVVNILFSQVLYLQYFFRTTHINCLSALLSFYFPLF